MAKKWPKNGFLRRFPLFFHYFWAIFLPFLAPVQLGAVFHSDFHFFFSISGFWPFSMPCQPGRIPSQPHQLHTKFRLPKCNVLTRNGSHEKQCVMSRKLPRVCKWFDTEYDRANVPPYNGNDAPPAPGSLKRSLFPTLLNEVQNKGTQGVRARYGAELPPIISIVRYPGRPVISVPEWWFPNGGSSLLRRANFRPILFNLKLTSS